MRTVFGFLFILVSLPVAFSQAENVRLAWDFDNGSLGGWSRNARGEIVLVHTPESGGLWYHFRIDGAEGQTVTFVFEAARADYYSTLNLPSVSYDQSHWFYIKNRRIEPTADSTSQVRFTFTQTFTKNRAWIAYTPPYTNTLFDSWLKPLASHPHLLVQTLCETPIKSQPLNLLHITDPSVPSSDKKTFLLFCREDAYETASSWIAQGAVDYLLSDDPTAAELKKKAIIWVVPIFDRDGVALGTAIHPLPATGETIFWTEAWPETDFSFHEQRQMKLFLQQWKDQGNRIDGCLRIHSNGWVNNIFRPENTSKENAETHRIFFADVLQKQLFPWADYQEPIDLETRFSKVVLSLFPQAITGFYQSDFVYPQAFHSPFELFKTTEDLIMEGEWLARAIAAQLGIVDNDPPPYLMAADLYETTANANRQAHVRCVYRDLLNRPPQFVSLMVNNSAHNLSKVHEEDQNYSDGVLYAGFITLEQAENLCYFTASNGVKNCNVPFKSPIPGPFLLTTQGER